MNTIHMLILIVVVGNAGSSVKVVAQAFSSNSLCRCHDPGFPIVEFIAAVCWAPKPFHSDFRCNGSRGLVPLALHQHAARIIHSMTLRLPWRLGVGEWQWMWKLAGAIASPLSPSSFNQLSFVGEMTSCLSLIYHKGLIEV